MRASVSIVAALVVSAAPVAADPAPRAVAVVVVVAKGSKISDLSRAELKRAFAGDTVVIDGERLAPFNHAAGTPERVAFDRVILGMSPEQVGRFWVDRKIRGEGQAPRSLPSAMHVTKIVAKFPSAISYLAASQVTPELKAVSIDGVAPSSAAYPIKLR